MDGGKWEEWGLIIEERIRERLRKGASEKEKNYMGNERGGGRQAAREGKAMGAGKGLDTEKEG